MNVKEKLYTKEEVITMFTDLQKHIKKTADEVKPSDVKWSLGLYFASKIIKDYINALKGEIT